MPDAMPEDACTCPRGHAALAHQGRTCAEVLWHIWAARHGRQWPTDTLAHQGRPVAQVLRNRHGREPAMARREAGTHFSG